MNPYRDITTLEQAMLVIQKVLDLVGEVKNRRGYLSGRMGEIDNQTRTNLDDRMTNSLVYAKTYYGIKTDYFLELALDDSRKLPDLEISKLVQISVVVQMRLRMRKHKTQHNVLCFVDSLRLLRKRYYLVTISELLQVFPDSFDFRKAIG